MSTYTRFHSWPIALAVVAISALTSCSDGARTSSGNDADIAGDVVGDATPDADVVTDADAFVVNEGEPNGPGNGTAISIPARIRGLIDPAQGGEPDTDVFTFDAQAGTVLRLTLTRSTIDPHILVRNESATEVANIRRVLHADTAGLTRQAYLPITGSYSITVRDVRNLEYELGLADEPVGGVDLLYELEVQAVEVAPEAVSLPLQAGGDDLPEGNGVRLWSFETVESGVFQAAVSAAESFELFSELDAALVLMNSDQTALVAENDDRDDVLDELDPLVRTAVGAESFVLVLDFFETGQDNPWELSAEVVDADFAAEPNESLGTAYPLPPADAGGEPTFALGRIDAPRDGTTDDDWFALGELSVGESVEITVEPAEGSALQPTIVAGALIEGRFGPEFFTASSRTGPDGTARFELTAIFDGPHLAIVLDDRNSFAGEDGELGDPVGGEDYDYRIEAVRFEHQSRDLGSTPIASGSDELSQLGQVDWYTFESNTAGFVLVEVTSPSFDASTWLLDRTAANGRPPVELGRLVELGDDFLVHRAPSGPTPYALAIFNERAWPANLADATYTFRLLSRAVERIDEDQQGDFPDEDESALEVAGDAAGYLGTLPADSEDDADRDVFAISLAAGNHFLAETYGPINEAPDPGPDDPVNADTELTLTGPGLDQPLVNDDFEGLFSQIRLTVPEGGGGTYLLAVTPYCSEGECSGGAYGLDLVILGD